ncbi:MAG: DUF6439 family protein [Cyanobacteriota bacterium]|nr:DUF6439 family protein [Cyanobacteriota bacterium]
MAHNDDWSSTVSDRQGDWPSDAREQAVALQRQLCIAERDWHRLKNQRARRAAEQLSGALVQLLSGPVGESAEAAAAQARALEQLEQAARWLRAEISDPGCGRQRRNEERVTAS